MTVFANRTRSLHLDIDSRKSPTDSRPAHFHIRISRWQGSTSTEPDNWRRSCPWQRNRWDTAGRHLETCPVLPCTCRCHWGLLGWPRMGGCTSGPFLSRSAPPRISSKSPRCRCIQRRIRMRFGHFCSWREGIPHPPCRFHHSIKSIQNRIRIDLSHCQHYLRDIVWGIDYSLKRSLNYRHSSHWWRCFLEGIRWLVHRCLLQIGRSPQHMHIFHHRIIHYPDS